MPAGLSFIRGGAFAGAVAIVDSLKTVAPAWKKEYLHDGGTAWVEGNAEGLPPR